MKKTLIIVSALLMCVVLLMSSVLTSFAETYSIYEGYKYRDVDSTNIAFCGRVDNPETLIVPNTIGSKTVYEIDSYAFSENQVLKTIDLSEAVNLRYVGTAAFIGCSSLESMVIPEWVMNLSRLMCANCTSLENLEVNMLPQIIPEEMCNGCSSLKSFVVPDSVTEIKRYAFGNCTSMTKVVIPAGVTKIAETAFENCPGLVIYCREGSYAQEYADAHNIPTALISKGDVDRDYRVTVNDATEIQKRIAELVDFDDEQIALADVDGDGDITIADATQIQFIVAM